VLRRVVAADGVETVGARDLPRETRVLPIAPEVFDVIRQGMVMAVNGQGTAARARSSRFTVAGKTGTAQVVGRDNVREGDEPNQDLQSHALFVGFAPAEVPQVSVLVLVENGGAGGPVAAPLARQILAFYDREIKPLAGPANTMSELSSSAPRPS
jgi:penicillin-binding protein 2